MNIHWNTSVNVLKATHGTNRTAVAGHLMLPDMEALKGSRVRPVTAPYLEMIMFKLDAAAMSKLMKEQYEKGRAAGLEEAAVIASKYNPRGSWGTIIAKAIRQKLNNES